MSSSKSEDQRSPEEIQADIERTREELGDTAAALAGKADVKGQAKAKVEDAKASVSEAASGFADKAQRLGSEAQGDPFGTVRTGADSALHRVRQNPMAVAFLAIVAAALLLGLIVRR